MPALCFVSSNPSLSQIMGSFRTLSTLSCSCKSSLDPVVMLPPVFVVTVMLFTLRRVGDGSSVPGRSLVVSVDVLACLLACASFCQCAILCSFSGAGSGCRSLCDVRDVAIGESVIACLIAGTLALCCASLLGASNVSSISSVSALISDACAGVAPGVLGSGRSVGAATVHFVGFHG